MIDIKVGQTKTVSHCAVGSICRAGDECFVICDTTCWTVQNQNPIGKPIPNVRYHLKKRLQSLGFNENIELRTPPILRHLPNGETIGSKIPAVRFPSFMVCLKCRKLHYLPWKNIKTTEGEYYESVSAIKCNNQVKGKKCGGRLEFVPYVLVHEMGYMDDVPWRHLSHRSVRDAQRCEFGDELYLERDDRTGRQQIICRKCGHKEDIDGLRKRNFFTWHRIMKKQPWLNETVSLPEGLPPAALSITDVNIHLPRTESSLDIPPESDVSDTNLCYRLQQHEEYDTLLEYFKDDQTRLFDNIKKRLAREFKCGADELKKSFDELQKGWPNITHETIENVDDEFMRKKEFDALCHERPFSKHARFVTRHLTKDWETFIEKNNSKLHRAIKKLIVVEKLKEIKVFTGFSRYRVTDDNVIKPSLDVQSDWLPACELFGEGLFFSLDEDVLKPWESQVEVIRRAEIVDARKRNSNLAFLPVAKPRFLLLHTLSHLLIRELEFFCGYPVSSIKEKIFCSPSMNGVLIYIAVPNKLGSLGGLAEQCKPEMFARLWSRVLEKSHQCSYNPICEEHEGQGVEQLNRAACHGCVLLPEITCENSNCLLDRRFLTGNEKTGMKGFIQYMSEN